MGPRGEELGALIPFRRGLWGDFGLKSGGCCLSTSVSLSLTCWGGNSCAPSMLVGRELPSVAVIPSSLRTCSYWCLSSRHPTLAAAGAVPGRLDLQWGSLDEGLRLWGWCQGSTGPRCVCMVRALTASLPAHPPH